jgi:hypothetical protein
MRDSAHGQRAPVTVTMPRRLATQVQRICRMHERQVLKKTSDLRIGRNFIQPDHNCWPLNRGSNTCYLWTKCFAPPKSAVWSTRAHGLTCLTI